VPVQLAVLVAQMVSVSLVPIPLLVLVPLSMARVQMVFVVRMVIVILHLLTVPLFLPVSQVWSSAQMVCHVLQIRPHVIQFQLAVLLPLPINAKMESVLPAVRIVVRIVRAHQVRMWYVLMAVVNRMLKLVLLSIYVILPTISVVRMVHVDVLSMIVHRHRRALLALFSVRMAIVVPQLLNVVRLLSVDLITCVVRMAVAVQTCCCAQLKLLARVLLHLYCVQAGSVWLINQNVVCRVFAQLGVHSCVLMAAVPSTTLRIARLVHHALVIFQSVVLMAVVSVWPSHVRAQFYARVIWRFVVRMEVVAIRLLIVRH
jgi:hypothetical protein